MAAPAPADCPSDHPSDRPARQEPEPGQESVWDYPRPPVVVPDDRRIQVRASDVILADTTRSQRVLETSQAPAFYLHPDDVVWEHLRDSGKTTWCEWKGRAHYLDVVVGATVIPDAAWCYSAPSAGFEAIGDHVAFYPDRVICLVDGETAQPMPGAFYGGWVTHDVVGPFKGAPGTLHW